MSLKIAHIITGLNTGGAETMLYRLLARLGDASSSSVVISLLPTGPVGDRLRDLGIPVYSLGMSRAMPTPIHLAHLGSLLKQAMPDVVQTWMYHSDLIGGVVSRLVLDCPVVWGIHAASRDLRGMKLSTRMVVRTSSTLARYIPARIVCCSEASMMVHAELGYPRDRMTVIPNGFDVSLFQPDRLARASVRGEIGVSPETPLIGLVARFDPVKDHKTFLRAAQLIGMRLPEVHFAMCGDAITPDNRELADMVGATGLSGRIHLLGRRDDVQRLHASFDIATSSSSSEAFPLVVGEAMACGTPCVVTDVGDSAIMVGESELVVPAGDPVRLASVWEAVLLKPRSQRVRMGMRGRQRIIDNYGIDAVLGKYLDVYREVISARGARGS